MHNSFRITPADLTETRRLLTWIVTLDKWIIEHNEKIKNHKANESIDCRVADARTQDRDKYIRKYNRLNENIEPMPLEEFVRNPNF